jgi:tRNA A-37 threonylcarbamoyl transferase component Bud32
MSESLISISKSTVTKKGNPARMRIEVEKCRRAFQIGRDCELFHVPQVLDYNDSNGVAVFERIDGIKPIKNAVSWGDEYASLAEILGSSLAMIHEKLKLPHEMIVPLPPELSFPGCDVFIHGDPSVYNICVGKRWPPIVILDWQMTLIHGGQATFGTRYFDLMWFIDNLVYRPTIRYLFSNPLTTVSSKFLDAYFKTARLEYKADEITSYAKHFFDLKKPLRKQQESRRFHFLLPRSHQLAIEFIESLSEIFPQK